MADITITYEVTDAKAYSTNGLQNVIKQVLFVIKATDGQNVKTSFFPVEFDDPDARTFVEYEQLTRQQVIDWVLAKVDPAHIEALKEGLTGVLQEMSANRQVVLQPVALPN